VGCYGLDAEALQKVANRINAPTLSQIHADPPEVPADHGMWAFREFATFG
jgi:hypothetical protein